MTVLFPDVEAEAIAYLQDALDNRGEAYAEDVTVSNAYQGADLVRQVVIRRDGGPQTDVTLEQPRLGVRVWAADDADATDLALLVAALFRAWPDGDPVTRARQLSGPSSIPEPNGRSLRYLVVELTVRGAQFVA